MGKDGSIRAMDEIKKGRKFNKWATYYWMNFLDEKYESRVPWKLLQLITFKKSNRIAKIMVYDNCIAFDINYWDEKNHSYMNIDRNDEEIIERVKMTKFWKLNILWAVSFVLGLWYEFIEDKIYEEEVEEHKLQSYYIWDAIQQSLF